VGHPKARECLENVSVDLQITLNRILRKWDGVEWIHLAFDRDSWPALVNTVINNWIPQSSVSFWLGDKQLASQYGLNFVEWMSWPERFRFWSSSVVHGLGRKQIRKVDVSFPQRKRVGWRQLCEGPLESLWVIGVCLCSYRNSLNKTFYRVTCLYNF